MNEYAQMYYKLFNKITDIIKELEAVQQQAEEIYISQEIKRTELPLLSGEETNTADTSASPIVFLISHKDHPS